MKKYYYVILLICFLGSYLSAFSQFQQLKFSEKTYFPYGRIVVRPDKKTFLTGNEQKTIKLWSSETGKLIRSFEGHNEEVTDIFLLSDNQTFLSQSNPSLVVNNIHKEDKDLPVKYWSLESGKLLYNFPIPKGKYIYSIDLLPDEKSFLIRIDSIVQQWSLETGKLIHTFEEHTRKNISQLVLLPERKVFFTVGDDKNIKLWSWETGKLIHSFEAKNYSSSNIIASPYSGITVSPDGKTFLTENYPYSDTPDLIMNQWSLESYQIIHSFDTCSYESNILFPDKDSFLAANNKNSISQWSLKTGELIHKFEGHTGLIGDLTLLPDSSSFLSSSADGTIKRWSLKTGLLIQTFKGHINPARQIFILPDKKTFLSIDGEDNVAYWSLESGKLLHSFKGEKYGASQIFLLPDKKTIFTIWHFSLDRDYFPINYWSLESGKLLHSFEGYMGYVGKIMWTADSKSFFSLSDSKTIKQRNIVSGKQKKAFSSAEDIYDFELIDDMYLVVLTKSGIIYHVNIRDSN